MKNQACFGIIYYWSYSLYAISIVMEFAGGGDIYQMIKDH